ncbi:MAG: hypothetical protein U0795_23475 [Pirellulales bacterium]
MSLFSFLGGRPTVKQWRQMVSDPPPLGPLKLHDDGSYSFGAMRFDQSCSFEDTNVGGAMVNKEAGAGEVLKIDTPHGEKLRFKFDANRWWCLA